MQVSGHIVWHYKGFYKENTHMFYAHIVYSSAVDMCISYVHTHTIVESQRQATALVHLSVPGISPSWDVRTLLKPIPQFIPCQSFKRTVFVCTE